MPSVLVPSSHKQSWSGIICTYQDFCIFIDQKKTTSELHLDTTFHWWPLNFLTHFSMHKKVHIYAHKMAVLLFFCRPLGLITDYKVLHPKATRFHPGQVSTDWKLSSLGCAVACMKWLGLSPAPRGSVCASQTPFLSAVTGKFAGRLSHFTILPSQTIASGQAWWRGCVIHFKVPVGLFLGTNSTGTQRFWNSTLRKHCKALRLYCIFLKWQVPSWKADPLLSWPCCR